MGLSAAIKSHPVFLSLLSVVLLPAFNVCLSLIVPEGLGKADTDRDAKPTWVLAAERKSFVTSVKDAVYNQTRFLATVGCTTESFAF